MYAIVGQKKEQTQKFREDGKRIPVTVVEVVNNPVIAVKTMEKDGYFAVQLGYGTQKNPNKPLLGHTKGANLDKAPHFLKEVRFAADTNEADMPKVGDFIEVSTVLAPGDVIDVTGVSKGKGFAGGVKRHGFHGGPKTHGQSDRHRAPGSIGSGTTPGRVYKGKRMAGKMGFAQVTVKNLVVVEVDGTTVWIQGLVPGSLKGLVMIKKQGEEKKFVPLLNAKKTVEPLVADEQQTQSAPEAAVSKDVDSSAMPQNDNKEESAQETVSVQEGTSNAVSQEAPLPEQGVTEASQPVEVVVEEGAK